MRIFFAVPVSNNIKEAVDGALRRSPLSYAPWKWIDPGNYHLTLRFLGDTDKRLLPPLRKAGGAAAQKRSPFVIRLGPFGGFPDLRKPRVIFCALEEGMDDLAQLASLLDQEIEYLGFEKERRPYNAHLTLARVKRPIDRIVAEQLESLEPLPEETIQKVDRFVLMQSRLLRSGASYEVIDEFILSGN
ncbi:MAG: RNA 2',3'-cyclic phosphodiesterase [Candidatus Krumholzibacteriota bacterium]|nr:RNA 2',3'-cyclic phosphodiesterase [Candidatus Krumholzibacteriota bacterium]